MNNNQITEEGVQVAVVNERPSFIESNTQAVTYEDLKSDYVPSFGGDSELTIPHANFIDVVRRSAETVFGEVSDFDARVSHPVVARKQEALYKKQEDLKDEDTTRFFQRMCFIYKVKNLTRQINGQEVNLIIGGVRSYNEDKLYGKKSAEKFSIFCGWRVSVCSNMMVSCDGNSGVVECMTELDLMEKAMQLFTSFNPIKEDNLMQLKNLWNTKLNEAEFCNLVGRLRLYQALTPQERKELGLPVITFGDSVCNGAVRNYTSNPNFGRETGELNCWNLMQLFNEAVKQCYIDVWLGRNQECTDLALGIQKSKMGIENPYDWFLQ